MTQEAKKFELGPNQRKWLEALKSGEYRHGKRKLCNLGKAEFCCLGVACEVFGVEKHRDEGEVFYAGKNTYAPPFVVDALKLNGNDATVVRDGRVVYVDEYGPLSLASINDDPKTHDFSPIVKIIEETPELVFTEPA